MGAKIKDLSGIKFNRLHVIEFYKTRRYGKYCKRLWKCRCDCGKIVYVNTGALTSNATKSCGCLHNEISSKNSIKSRNKIAKIDAGYKSIYASYRSNAISRKHVFNIDFNYFKKLLISNCFYCNIEPSNTYFKSYYNVKYNGIDRINNKIGYIESNIVPCCKMCNISKNNYDMENFLNWIERISINYSNVKQKLKSHETKRLSNTDKGPSPENTTSIWFSLFGNGGKNR